MKKRIVCLLVLLTVFIGRSCLCEAGYTGDEMRLISEYPHSLAFLDVELFVVSKTMRENNIGIAFRSLVRYLSGDEQTKTPSIEQAEKNGMYLIQNAAFRKTEGLNATITVTEEPEKSISVTFAFIGEYKGTYDEIPCVEDTINYHTSRYGKPSIMQNSNSTTMEWDIYEESSTCKVELVSPSLESPFPEAIVTFAFKAKYEF